jgi:hypothetical protein
VPPWPASLGGYRDRTGGEMGHLYVELGGVSPASITGIHDADYDLFQNIQSDNSYWSGTEYAPDAANLAFGFLFASGSGGDSQTVFDKAETRHVWAVRDGDVVPEPAAGWLFALAGLVSVGRRIGAALTSASRRR